MTHNSFLIGGSDSDIEVIGADTTGSVSNPLNASRNPVQYRKKCLRNQSRFKLYEKILRC